MEVKTIIDDVTGLTADDATKTKITVGDVSGELDLSPESLAALRELASGGGSAALAALLAPAPVAARSTRPRSGGKRSGDSAPHAETGMTAEEMRTWAAEHKMSVNPRGRVPKDVVAAIVAAQKSGKPTLTAAPASGKTSAPDAGAGADVKPDGKPATVG